MGSAARTTPPKGRVRNGLARPNAKSTVAAQPDAREDEPREMTSVPVMDALRARITGGAIFFNERALVRNDVDGTAQYESPEFSTASTYLAFEAQPRLWPMAEHRRRDSYRRVYLEGIANVRLTTIGATGGDESVGSGGIELPEASVLKSQKSAQLQFGVLTSIIITAADSLSAARGFTGALDTGDAASAPTTPSSASATSPIRMPGGTIAWCPTWPNARASGSWSSATTTATSRHCVEPVSTRPAGPRCAPPIRRWC